MLWHRRFPRSEAHRPHSKPRPVSSYSLQCVNFAWEGQTGCGSFSEGLHVWLRADPPDTCMKAMEAHFSHCDDKKRDTVSHYNENISLNIDLISEINDKLSQMYEFTYLNNDLLYL